MMDGWMVLTSLFSTKDRRESSDGGPRPEFPLCILQCLSLKLGGLALGLNSRGLSCKWVSRPCT